MAALPSDITEVVESALGLQIVAATPATGGCTPAARFLVDLEGGTSAFVKAATSDDTAAWLRAERQVYDGADAPCLPRVLAWAGDDRRPVLVLEDLRDAHWPPPWTDDLVAAVDAALHQLHATKPPAGLKRMRETEFPSWHDVLSEPAPFLGLGLASPAWLAASGPVLTRAHDAVSLEGSDLCHQDVRSDNLCRQGDRVLLVDWNWACVGNGQVDRAFWSPSLASEGGPRPDELLPDAPAYAALVSGHFAATAGLPPMPHAPKVRPLQLRQLDHALPWAVRALDLPPLDGPQAGRLSATR